MKTKLFGIILCAGIFTACNNEDLFEQGSSIKTLKVSTESELVGSRAGMESDGSFFWHEADKIGALMSNNEVLPMTLKEGDGGKSSGNFEITTNLSFGNYAIYPYSTNHDLTSEGELTFNLPSSYDYGEVIGEKENSFNIAMWGALENGGVSFKHLGGVFKIYVHNLPVGDDMQFIFKTDGKRIAGDFEADLTDDEPILETAAATAGDDQVIISFKNATANASGVFYIPAPVGDYPVINVTLKNGDEAFAWGYWENQKVVRRAQKKGTIGKKEITGGGESETVEGVAAANKALQEGAEEVVISAIPQSETVTTILIPGQESDEQSLSIAIESISYENEISIEDASSTTGDNPIKTLNLTLPEEAVAKLNIDLPNTTVYINGKIADLQATTAEHTLIVNEGASITNLTINGGNVRLHKNATIGSLTNATGGVIYLILEADATTSIAETENIKIVSAAEYDLRQAIADGGSYTLTGDVLNISELIKVEKDLVLDLNGYTLAFTPQSGYPGIKNTANLEVKNGKITSTQVGIQNNGTLTINCDIESVENAINNVYDGETTIEGGSYKNTSTEKALINSDNFGDGTPVLTINGGSFESVFTNVSYNNGSTGTVNGGTFKCTGGWHNIYVGGSEGGCNVTYDAENCSFESNGINIQVNNWGVEGNKNTLNNVEYTGAHNIYFASTETALRTAIAAGGEVALGTNISNVSALIKVEKDLVLDLNGYTLAFTPQSGYPGIKNTANLEVKNGKITSTQVGIQNNGTLTINCDIESVENAINNVYDGETTIEGGSYKNTSTEKALINSDNFGDGTPVLTINGGSFESVFTNVSYNNGSTGSVNAGTFKCTGGWHNIYVGGETGGCNVTYKEDNCTFESNGIKIQVNDWGVGNANTVNNTTYTSATNLLN